MFFFAFSMALSNLGSNISANTLSASNDLCALFPRYVNLRRGSLITAVIGCWAVAPWKLLATASSFLTLLGGCEPPFLPRFFRARRLT
jgi:nucleobase:cation symporter-1, NCS1 family